MIPDYADVIFEHSLIMPDYADVIFEHSLMIPENADVIFERSLMMPDCDHFRNFAQYQISASGRAYHQDIRMRAASISLATRDIS